MTKHLLIQLEISSIVSLINKSQDYGAVGYNENFTNIKTLKNFSVAVYTALMMRGCQAVPKSLKRVDGKIFINKTVI